MQALMFVAGYITMGICTAYVVSKLEDDDPGPEIAFAVALWPAVWCVGVGFMLGKSLWITLKSTELFNEKNTTGSDVINSAEPKWWEDTKKSCRPKGQ